MKKTSLITRLAIVAVALTAAGTSARATSQVPAYTNGDLLLGFYDFSGSVTNDYLVDLGPMTNFNFSHNFSISHTASNMGADLNTVFDDGGGTNAWFTSGNIMFGLAASYPLTGQVFVSNPLGNGAPWTESAAQGTPATEIENAGQTYSSAFQTHGETDPRGLQQTDGANESWFNQAAAAGANGSFGNFFGSAGDGSVSDYVTNSLEFDEVNVGPDGTPSTALGTFALDSSGDLIYTAAAIPEPSTYAIVALGTAILVIFRRRRQTV